MHCLLYPGCTLCGIKKWRLFFYERSYSLTNGPMRFGECLLSDSFLVESQENACGKITVWINIRTHFSTLTPLHPEPTGCSAKGVPRPSWEVRIHSVVLTHFSAFGGYNSLCLVSRVSSPLRPPQNTEQVIQLECGACGQRWAGEGGVESWGCGQEEIRANSSKTIWQEMTECQAPTTLLGLPSQREPPRGRSPS